LDFSAKAFKSGSMYEIGVDLAAQHFAAFSTKLQDVDREIDAIRLKFSFQRTDR
jgi:hypothetical protein